MSFSNALRHEFGAVIKFGNWSLSPSCTGLETPTVDISSSILFALSDNRFRQAHPMSLEGWKIHPIEQRKTENSR